jgi:DNA recombination protein RmuC
MGVNTAIFIIFGVLALGVLIFAFRSTLLKLQQSNEEQRKGHKDEIDQGVRQMIEDSRKTMDTMVEEMRRQIAENQREMRDVHGKHVQGIGELREALKVTNQVTEKLGSSTDQLRNLLTNNRLKGGWGEQIAEDLLIGSGFVENVTYTKQKQMGSGGRPDFTILLPDGHKLNIDVKFPFDDLIAYQESENDLDKRRHIKAFETAMKDKIRSMATREYINPEEQTLDFVVMFIPNEMIFSFIFEKLPELSDYAFKQKVVLAGPFGLTAVLRLVFQSYRSFQYEKSIQEILGLIEKFRLEYDRYSKQVEKLGSQLDTVQKTFFELNTTRDKQLTRVVERIGQHSELGAGSEEPAQPPQPELIERR